MAKNKTETEIETEIDTAHQPETNIVKMEDGSIVSFGSRARLVSDQTITPTGFELIFNLISGKILKYSLDAGREVPKLLLEMAAFGAGAKAKASTAGAKDADEIEKIIVAKIAEFTADIFVTRGAAAPAALTMYQEAYCKAYVISNPTENWDCEDASVITKVKSLFADMSKEDKTAMMKSPAIRIQVNQIRLAQAQAELAAEQAAS